MMSAFGEVPFLAIFAHDDQTSQSSSATVCCARFLAYGSSGTAP
jgi:hypothetical protein